MGKVLGLDLGTNSIGWAVVEEDKQEILGMGSRIFPEGVTNLGEGEGREKSKNASRTDDRGVRRQIYRRRMRKKILLKKLAEYAMCPLTDIDFKEWKSNKRFPENKLKSWFQLNPYELRHKALYEKLTLEEIGRVFYHLIQRRGFQSNSRKNNKEDGAIFKGDVTSNKIGIDETRQQIEDKTLGEYLYTILPKENSPFVDGQERVRNRYTTRDMYIKEFDQIWRGQSKFHECLTDNLRIEFGGRLKEGDSKDGVLFHQRPLKSQKHLLGKCQFEPTKNKCPKSAIIFEEFRCYQWLNTIECNGEKLTETEQDSILKLMFKKERFKFKEARKAINKQAADFKFNYKDDDNKAGTHTISNLSNKKFFGPAWFEMSRKEQEDNWHIIYFFEDKDKLLEYAMNNWSFNAEAAEKISSFNLKEGYANLSYKAISNILPFLKLGLTYDKAVVLGGVKNAFGKKWEILNFDEETFIIEKVLDLIDQKQKGGFIEPLKEMLIQEFNIEERDLKKLYHHSASTLKDDVIQKLLISPDADMAIQKLKNPVVVTALFEIRRVVNELIDRFGNFDEIKIELARDLKASKSQRYKTRREQQRLEKENNRVKDELNHHNIRITHDNIVKYKLWEECKKTCPFTGKSIGIEKLFSGEIQIEHIHPWSRSLNDSFMNKTLCYTDENRAKGNKTPFEFYGNNDAKWEEVKERALKLFADTKEYPKSYHKFKHFVKQKHDDDFISRQLNDTRYISKEAKNYLEQICKKVNVSPGMVTANLRYKWGLNNLLNKEGDEKTRDDHRHHAIDALVVACTKVKFVQELSKWNSYERNYELKDFPKPWKSFREDAQNCTNQILVSHKKNKPLLTIRNTKVEKNGKTYVNTGIAARGLLHKETVYGKRKGVIDGTEAFHVRKPLDSITTLKQIEKVADPTIKKLIISHIEKIGGFEKGSKVPKNAFFIKDEASGKMVPQLFLPNKNGAPVPIKKVRMRENIGGAEQLKTDINQHVNPRNNHHVLIYKDEKGNLNEDVVTFWTAVERKKQGLPVIQLPKPIPGKPEPTEILTTLQINDMFLLGLADELLDWNDLALLKNHLYRVQKLSSKFYEFRLSIESKLNAVGWPKYCRIQSFGLGKTGWQTFNPIKVIITPTGQIKPV